MSVDNNIIQLSHDEQTLRSFFLAWASAFITLEASLASIKMSGRAPLSRALELVVSTASSKSASPRFQIRPLPSGLFMLTSAPPLTQILHRVSGENWRDGTSLVHCGREDLQDRGGVDESPDEEVE